MIHNTSSCPLKAGWQFLTIPQADDLIFIHNYLPVYFFVRHLDMSLGKLDVTQENILGHIRKEMTHVIYCLLHTKDHFPLLIKT